MRRKLAFALTALCLLLLVVEGFSRVALMFIPDRPSPMDEPIPAFAAKTPGTLRVVTFGESTVAGFPDPDLGFVEQMRYWLPKYAPQQPVEIVNLALGGLNSSDVLRRVRQTLAEGAPDLLIVMVGHNEFLDRQVASPLGLWLERAEVSGVVRLLRRVLPTGQSAPSQAYFLPDRLYPLDPDSFARRRREKRFKRNIAAIASAARKAGVPLYLCTLACNLRDWPPVYKKVGWAWGEPNYEQQARAVIDSLPKQYPAVFEAALNGLAPSRDPSKDAFRIFYQARSADIAWAGKSPSVLDAFRKARDLDPIPWRVLTEFNTAIQMQADPNAKVVDIEALFVAQPTNHVPGFDLIADNCHPNVRGHALIAERLIAQMAQEGRLGEAARAPGSDLSCPVEEYTAQLAQKPGKAYYESTFYVLTAIYCMKPPFFNYDAAWDYLKRAEAIQPPYWTIHANLGTIALMREDWDEARTQLKRARELSVIPLPLEERGSIPYLKEALAAAPPELNQICTQ